MIDAFVFWIGITFMRKVLLLVGLLSLSAPVQAMPSYNDNPTYFCSELKRITASLAHMSLMMTKAKEEEIAKMAKSDSAEWAVIYNALCKD